MNKTIRSNIPPKLPYKYVTASLDLSGAVNGDTFYFNLDNSLEYRKMREYYRFIRITKESIIGEVDVYVDNPIQTVQETLNGPLFTIGGALNTSSRVVVPYAAPSFWVPLLPPQFNGSSLRTFEINQNPTNYFGHSAAKFPYGEDNNGNPDPIDNYQLLAITVSSIDFPLGTPLIVSGLVRVVLKVYTK